MLNSIKIEGLRGFSKEQTLIFSKPNGKKGSGLTTLVGINNSGKTTIIEAIKYYNCDVNNISFSQGKRNIKCDGKVSIEYTDFDGNNYILKTKEGGGSQVEISNSEYQIDGTEIPFILPSRRHVNYEINSNFYQSNRYDYVNNEIYNTKVREPIIDSFHQRIFNWELNKDRFNELLYKVLDKSLQWYIEQNDNGSYYLAFKSDENSIHSSEGIGDGIWSVFTIIDAIYDATEKSVVVIDEPELSLHPMYQKKVLELLLEASKTKQIIISTHSPYFISWNALKNGGMLYRTYKKENNICVCSLKENDIKFITSSLNNYYNPHIWGIDAKELFFLEDNIIIVEGQEDVIAFNKICDELNIHINAEFFGWGAGGASNIEKILCILQNLGYEKICAIYDGDKKDEFESVCEKFPNYKIVKLWKDDIRDRPKRMIQFKEGILDKSFEIKEGTVEKLNNFIKDLSNFFE